MMLKINALKLMTNEKFYSYVKFKNYERKTKSPFIIYVNFESVLVPEGNEKQNPEES